MAVDAPKVGMDEVRKAALYTLYSAPTAIEGKTVRLRHEILRLDGEAVATSEVIALVIDLASRKSVPMPQFAAAGAHA